MSSVPVPDKRNSADSLENFAKRIEERLRIGKDKQPFAMERLICRLLSGTDKKVSATLAAKWAEWRYGKASQPISGDDAHPIRVLVEHIGTQDKTPAKAD